MAFARLLTSYSAVGVVGKDGKGGFVDSESFRRVVATYEDFRNEQVPVTADDLRQILLTKEDLYRLSTGPEPEYSARIKTPTENDLIYDHVVFDLSTYKKEDHALAHQIIGDALRNPNFIYTYDNGKNPLGVKKVQEVPLHGKRAVVDMGIHYNTGHPHCQFLVMSHTINADKTISASASFRKGEFRGQQIREINQLLEARGLDALEPMVVNPDALQPAKSGNRARRPEQDTVQTTNALIESASIHEEETSLEETREILEENFQERDRQSSAGMDEDQLRKIQIDRELNGTRSIIEQRIEEINRLRSNAKALELASLAIEENQQLRGDLNLAQADIAKLKEIASLQQKTIVEFKQTNETLENTIEEIQAANRQEVQLLKEEITEKTEKIETISVEFDELSKDNETLTKALANEKQKNVQLELDFGTKKAELEATIQDLRDGKTLLIAEKEDLTSKLAASETKSAGLETRVAELMAEIEQEKQARVTAESQVKALEGSFKTFQERSDQQFAAMQARFDEQIKRLEANQAKELKQVVDSQKKDLETKIADVQKQNELRTDQRTSELEAAAREFSREVAKTNPEKAAELERRFDINRTRNTQTLSKEDIAFRTNAEERKERKLREKKAEEDKKTDGPKNDEKGPDTDGPEGPDDENTPNKKRRR